MKLQFKYQKFQAEAAKAVVDVFAGQPNSSQSYSIDNVIDTSQQMSFLDEVIGQANKKIVPSLTDDLILQNLQRVQHQNQLEPSKELKKTPFYDDDNNLLDECYNLTIEMETGVGKTYTYIKTMYELNKHYGWSKFIIVVPSIAIREGVYKTFQVTEEHFAEEYGKKIRYFIYNSSQLTNIEHFASDSSINVMIINVQAFNARGTDARRISMQLDEFGSRRPIDVIAATNPILIIDEPQVVEGKNARKNLQYFKPLLTLRYSATHRADSIYNMVYRLDALEAYNKHLVKKIAVKGISRSTNIATNGFVYLERINLSNKANPTATIQFDCKGANGVRKVTRTVREGFNLYEHSGRLDEYKDGFIVKLIDGRENKNYIEFLNDVRVYAGDINGKVDEEQIRRIQIRETIKSHIEREYQLFNKGIKVLSLFFIDAVAHYKQYDSAGKPLNGDFANWFEEEYKDIVAEYQADLSNEDYLKYLKSIPAEKTHAGYFSIDKKGRITDGTSNKEKISDDIDAYSLIMKNKELLLDQNPQKSPVRFIFSHSALREGWDNPNVFQICTLKQSDNKISKKQEVGRGLRLCVNQQGERMDENILNNGVHKVNVLTVIASESYDEFAKQLQKDLAEAVADRPRTVTAELFKGKFIKDSAGNKIKIDDKLANSIIHGLIVNLYIDEEFMLTDKYNEDKKNGGLKFSDKVKDYSESIVKIINSVCNLNALKPDNAFDDNIKVKINKDKFDMQEFKALWEKINARSFYEVSFETDELVEKAVSALNERLNITKMFFSVETGELVEIKDKQNLETGTAFTKNFSENVENTKMVRVNSNIKYDLVGKLVEETRLTRKVIAKILKSMDKETFAQFQYNPEEFIIKVGNIINEMKATTIVEHITYHLTGENYDIGVFTESELKGNLEDNIIETKKHIYDHLIYDSEKEREFAEDLESHSEVVVYVKLPSEFFISTPMGKYNPDWAIAFKEEGDIKHIYFVAETKGSTSFIQLRQIEKDKIKCASKHFEALNNKDIKYAFVDGYKALINEVMR